MINADELRSGKTRRDENFPVASWLIKPRNRAPILAFYEFVRTADDIADHPDLPAQQKLELLDSLEADLVSGRGDNTQALALCTALHNHGLSQQHPLDILKAFRLDVTKRRYTDWNDLMGYCAYSAMPVGRFVLDVHNESRATWPASDSLCAALQIINHLQDCGDDYRNLDRVYVPLDALEAAGVGVESLGKPHASPPLRRCLNGLAERTATLLGQAKILTTSTVDWRLGMEIAIIHRLAQRLTRLLATHDPLSETTHLGKLDIVSVSLLAVLQGAAHRLRRGKRAPFGLPRT